MPPLATAAAQPFMVQAVVLIVAAAVIAYLSYRIGLVPIVGFLLAGAVIGPHALGLVKDPELVNQAAEIGVMLLLFTIGIEFSLDKLASLKTLIFGGGGLQVVLTSLATMLLLRLGGVSWQAGLFTGFLVALSSTAIALKLLADRGESDTTWGQVALGLLIFQDLAVVVMVLLVPMLGGQLGSTADIVIALTKALAIIAIVLMVARRVMPPLLERVARTCSPELFLLAVVAICFGTAWLTSLAGVSLSLGAFLAGLVVSESRFSQHAFGEIMPLEILFSAMFFVSVGMLLDGPFVLAHLPLVLLAVAVVLVLKVLVTTGAALALGHPLSVAAASAFVIAQIGEFSFVLARAGESAGLFPAGRADAGGPTFIAASVLLMVISPQLAAIASSVSRRLDRRRVAREAERVMDADSGEPVSVALSDHVIVAGYGGAARHLVRVLRGSGIPFVITTLNPGGAREAEAEQLLVLRGDAGRQLTLTRAGIERARVVVIADDDLPTTYRVSAVARTLAPGARILTRTRYMSEIASLKEAGSDHVVSEELESIVGLFSEVLRTYKVDAADIESHEESIRGGGYAALLPSEDAAKPAPAGHTGHLLDTTRTVTLTTTSTACSHLDQSHPVKPASSGCAECLRIGSSWVHLRICMICGNVGCCDSSPNRHATAHYHASGHPIMRSGEPEETWGWCYVDQIEL